MVEVPAHDELLLNGNAMGTQQRATTATPQCSGEISSENSEHITDSCNYPWLCLQKSSQLSAINLRTMLQRVALAPYLVIGGDQEVLPFLNHTGWASVCPNPLVVLCVRPDGT